MEKMATMNVSVHPIAVALPRMPASMNADMMTDEQLHMKLRKGYDDIEAGKVHDAANAFAKFREKHS